MVKIEVKDWVWTEHFAKFRFYLKILEFRFKHEFEPFEVGWLVLTHSPLLVAAWLLIRLEILGGRSRISALNLHST